MRLLVLSIIGLALALPAAGQTNSQLPTVDSDSRIRQPGAAPATGKQPAGPKGSITWGWDGIHAEKNQDPPNARKQAPRR